MTGQGRCTRCRRFPLSAPVEVAAPLVELVSRSATGAREVSFTRIAMITFSVEPNARYWPLLCPFAWRTDFRCTWGRRTRYNAPAAAVNTSDPETYVWPLSDFVCRRHSHRQISSSATMAQRLHGPDSARHSGNRRQGHLMPRLRRSDLITSAVDEEIVVLDRAAGYVHQLNATASQIWRACDGRHSVEDIAAQVTQRFDIAPDSRASGRVHGSRGV